MNKFPSNYNNNKRRRGNSFFCRVKSSVVWGRWGWVLGTNREGNRVGVGEAIPN
jgi:hypothetical protein